ncbi:MAG: Carboxypeptidase regulatory-like domain, partial [Acidobacteriaceae bacterium]|nr:Carboxypeptidase regulatory-like domain [Acidobacteriaceae bacterium]
FLALVLGLTFGGPCVYGGPQRGHSAELTGEVLSPTGKPVAAAVVTYQSGGGHTPHAVHTDANGRFTILKLRRDNYDLRASSHGWYSTWEKNVMVRSGQVKSITLRLTDGAEAAKSSVIAPRQ